MIEDIIQTIEGYDLRVEVLILCVRSDECGAVLVACATHASDDPSFKWVCPQHVVRAA